MIRKMPEKVTGVNLMEMKDVSVDNAIRRASILYAKRLYLEEIADDHATNVATSILTFMAFCTQHGIELKDVEWGLDHKRLVWNLICWRKRQIEKIEHQLNASDEISRHELFKIIADVSGDNTGHAKG